MSFVNKRIAFKFQCSKYVYKPNVEIIIIKPKIPPNEIQLINVFFFDLYFSKKKLMKI